MKIKRTFLIVLSLGVSLTLPAVLNFTPLKAEEDPPISLDPSFPDELRQQAGDEAYLCVSGPVILSFGEPEGKLTISPETTAQLNLSKGGEGPMTFVHDWVGNRLKSISVSHVKYDGPSNPQLVKIENTAENSGAAPYLQYISVNEGSPRPNPCTQATPQHIGGFIISGPADNEQNLVLKVLQVTGVNARAQNNGAGDTGSGIDVVANPAAGAGCQLSAASLSSFSELWLFLPALFLLLKHHPRWH